MQEDQYKNHGVWQLLLQAVGHLESYPDDQRRTPQFLEARERIEYMRWVLEQSDPSLIAPQELDSVQAPLQQAVNHIQQNTARAQRLSQLDQWFAPFVDRFPYPRVRKIFRSERTEILNEFESQILEMQAQLREFFGSAEAEQKKIEEQLSKLDGHAQNLEKSLQGVELRVDAEFEKWEAQSAQQISARLSELNSEFSSDQNVRNADHQKRLDELAEKVRTFDADREEAKRALSSALTEMQKKLEVQQDQFQKDAKNYLEKIREIYQISGQTALAGDFENAAKAESASGRNFAVLSVILFVIAPIFFVVQWSETNVSGVQPLDLVLKLSSGLAFLIPAAYFGNTSRRHHRVATALRSLGIKVATFDAYLANFPDAERNRIKEEMAELFFAAQISPDQVRKSSPKEIERVLGLADTALSQAQSTMRSIGGGA